MRQLVFLLLLALLAVTSSTPAILDSGSGVDVAPPADVSSAESGDDTAATGDVSTAESGDDTATTGDVSSAESGDDTAATGDVSSAESGDDTAATGDVSSAGSGDDTAATGDVSTAESGDDTAATGDVISADSGDVGAAVPGDSGSGDDATEAGDANSSTEKDVKEVEEEATPKPVFIPPILNDQSDGDVVSKGVVQESEEEEETGGNEHQGEAEAEVQTEQEEEEKLRDYLKAMKKDKSLPPPENSEFPNIDIKEIMKEDGVSTKGLDASESGTKAQSSDSKTDEKDDDKTDEKDDDKSDEKDDDNTDEKDDDKSENKSKAGRRRRSLRVKRFLDANKEWPKGIVPYVFTSSVPETSKPGILVAMNKYEKNTCIRFKPKTGTTREDFGLDHDCFLSFKTASGCWATQGNSRSDKGQSISCCSWGVCVHELGHALGAWHEHQSPLRQGLLRVNWDGIKPNFARWYVKTTSKNIIVDGYDSQSIMSYQPWSFALAGKKTMDSLFPREITFGYNTFYLFKEISKSHKCQELYCKSFGTKCVNDGYVTLVNNECACVCPRGLDPKKGCAEIEKKVPAVTSWPKGQFALDAVVGADCPAGFKSGTRKHFSGPGTWRRGGHVGKEISWTFMVNEFCVKTDAEGKGDWPRGKYCILRKGGSCPKGFTEGSVKFDDKASAGKGESKEPLPDGKYDEDTTLEFCCRRDGFVDDPLDLPISVPLVLYMVDYWQDCQEIRGMSSYKEMYIFKHASKTGSKLNGTVPYIGSYWQSFYMFYCYYTPLDKDCGDVIELSASKPTAVITSPGYEKGAYRANLHCDWLIKGPPKSTLVAEFEDFQVEEKAGTCQDSLELRLDRLAQKGHRLCGEGGIEESYRTLHETLMLTLRTNGANHKKGFKVKVKAILAEDQCYNLNDNGATYRGNVNFTRDFKACVDWRLMTQCENNLWNEPTNMLETNLCRNPSGDLRPWCYTQVENCQRGYCDVCGTEKPFDTLKDCAQLKAKGFCQTDKREVLHGCALTCADTLGLPLKAKKFAGVTCAAPEVPSDAEMTSGSQKSFKVGDSITLKCKTDGQTFKQQCLTNGKWSPAGYVCGGCPSGWRYVGGNCYHFTTTSMKGLPARKYCADLGATLPMPKSAQEIDVVDKIRPPMTRVWLGITDEKVENTWLFLDGSSADSIPWEAKEPNNWYNEDCATLNPTKKVSDIYCNSHWAMAPVMCVKPAKEPSLCADRREDCTILLEDSPKMCQDQPDFAAVNCRYTCGVCKPDSTPQCSVPAAGSNMRLVTATSKLSRGQAASYLCNEGYVVTKGSLNRACDKKGQLSGGAPECTVADKAVTSVDPGHLIDRKQSGKAGYAYTGNNDNFRITRRGRMIEWHFFSKQPRKIAFVVFRHRSELPNTMLELVGYNEVTSEPDRVNHIWKVPESQQIYVENGDLVGIWYGPGAGGVPFDNVDAAEHPAAVGVMITATTYTTMSGLKTTTPITFKAETSAQIFSFRAVVGPTDGHGPRDLTKFESVLDVHNNVPLATDVPEVEEKATVSSP